ncbi:MAG: hypothetical protein LAP85_12575 [Acidobacteriia bacterium]|nr:hypothetical protein [Terriglobia bacterium]
MLTQEQKRRYEETLELAKDELEQLDLELAAEITRAKERLHELQEAKKAVKLIYDGALARLGVQSDLKVQNYDLAELEKHA